MRSLNDDRMIGVGLVRPLYDHMIEHIIKLNNKHHVGRLFIDASNAAFTTSLKQPISDINYRSYATNSKLITSSRTALVNHSFDDILDSFQRCCLNYPRAKRTNEAI